MFLTVLDVLSEQSLLHFLRGEEKRIMERVCRGCFLWI